jgi:hypothetical protein
MNKHNKTCKGCGIFKPAVDFYKTRAGRMIAYCKPCHNIRGMKRYRALCDAGLCAECATQIRLSGKSKCAPCWAKEQIRTKRWRTQVFKQVIAFYGNCCVCCGERITQFLTIDHINNDGYLERRNTGIRGGYRWYQQLLAKPKREDLQILCYNCNNGRHRNNGICPHFTAKDN